MPVLRERSLDAIERGQSPRQPAPPLFVSCPDDYCPGGQNESTPDVWNRRPAAAHAPMEGLPIDWDMESKDVLGVIDAIYADYSSTFGMTPNDFMAKQMRRVQARLFDWWTTNREAIRSAIVSAEDVPKLRASLVRACNATGAWCSNTVSNAFLAEVGQEVEKSIAALHSPAAGANAEVARKMLTLPLRRALGLHDGATLTECVYRGEAEINALRAAQPREWDAETIKDAPEGMYFERCNDPRYSTRWGKTLSSKRECLLSIDCDKKTPYLWEFFGPIEHPQPPATTTTGEGA